MRAVHRDVGFTVAALTLAYAVSGLAVNHVADWNPNWTIAREERSFAPFPVTDREAMVARLVQVLALPGPPRDSFRRAPERIDLFYDGWTVEADVARGVARWERPKERPVLRDLNFMHLNHGKGAWTWIADAYAVLLGTLAVTGLFIMQGRRGLAGRGKWFLAAGLAVPLVYLALTRYL